MHVRLSRSCIRWLRYTIVVVIVLLFIYGMTILSGGKVMIPSAEFDTSNARGFHGNGSVKNQKNIESNIKDISNTIEFLKDEYDIEDEQLNQLFAKVDKTLKIIKETINEKDSSLEGQQETNDLIDNVPNVVIGGNRDTEELDGNLKGVAFAGDTGIHIQNKGIYKSADSANIVISSYGINKTTVIDDLFHNREDTIVFDQPSLTLWPLWYLRGDNQVCSMKSSTCRLAGEDTSTTVMKCLIGLLRCLPEALDSCLSPSGSIGHKKIEHYTACRQKARTESDISYCLRLLRNMCTTASIRVLSVRNLAVDFLGQLLKYIQNTHIIHVFPDSRSVMFSKKMTKKAYLNKSGDLFIKRAKNLCERTQSDFDTARDLQSRDSHSLNTFHMVTHENLLSTEEDEDYYIKISVLFQMEINNITVYDVIKNSTSIFTVLERHRESESEWRVEMDKDAISVAYMVCKDTYEQLGIKPYSDIVQLVDY